MTFCLQTSINWINVGGIKTFCQSHHSLKIQRPVESHRARFQSSGLRTLRLHLPNLNNVYIIHLVLFLFVLTGSFNISLQRWIICWPGYFFPLAALISPISQLVKNPTQIHRCRPGLWAWAFEVSLEMLPEILALSSTNLTINNSHTDTDFSFNILHLLVMKWVIY